ncbi:MAG: hypothetical protein ACYDBB_17665 [Armatimonadota bacterium]
MRTFIYLWLLLVACWALLGCGGGGSDAPFTNDPNVVGNWVDTAPYGAGGAQPDAEGYWPTRTLSLRSDQTFRFEDSAPENWVTGTYEAANGVITFTRKDEHGATTFFSSAQLGYALFNNTLAITEDTGSSSRAMQFSAQENALLPVLAQEWLLAVRRNSTNADLPVVESTRLIISLDGSATLIRCNAPAQTFTTCQGTAFTTKANQLCVRLLATGATPGHLYMLGDYSAGSNLLSLLTPDNTEYYYTPRVAPDTHLIGQWDLQGNGGSGTLIFNSDGTYTLNAHGANESGTWRTYRWAYLCLISSTGQRTFAWTIWGNTAPYHLTLAEWTAGDPANPAYTESTWLQHMP